MNFEVLSKHREKIMGLAIISIIIFHYFEDVRIFMNVSPIIIKISKIYNVIIGSIGVDIFLIVSAIGLYYSYSKNNNLVEFYKKRIKRVLIPYIIICGIYWIVLDIFIKKLSIIYFFKDFLWISFFTEHVTTFWYILAIVILYFLFPIIYRFINNGGNKKYKLLILTMLDILLNIFIFIFNRNLYNNIEIFLIRVLDFIIGMFLAQKVYNKDKISKKYIIKCGILLLVTFSFKLLLFKFMASIYYLINRYLTAIIAITGTILLAIALENINFRRINEILKSVGQYTLELYIFHVAYRELFNYFNHYTSILKFEILMLVLSIISSIAFNKTYKYLSTKRIKEVQ